MRLVKTPEDEERFKQHLVKLHALFVAYVVEVSQVVAGNNSDLATLAAAPAAVDSSVAAGAVGLRS
jgi:hypothetical protein